MTNTAQLKSKVREVIDKLETLSTQRSLTSNQRRSSNISVNEIRVVEGEFDAVFKREVANMEHLLTEIARDSLC